MTYSRKTEFCGSHILLPLIFSSFHIFLHLVSLPSTTANDNGGMIKSRPTGFLANIWTEDRQAASYPKDLHTLYPRERHCKPPEITEPSHAIKHDQTGWSMIFSRYSFDAGGELESWHRHQEFHKYTQQEKQDFNRFEIFVPLIFPISMIIFLGVSLIFIPLLGGLGYRILEAIWYLTTHPEVRRTGRRALITIEKTKRGRNKMLLPDGVKKPPKSHFYLPKFFRAHSGEDVPEELLESEEDEVWITRGMLSEDEEEDENLYDKHRKFKVGASLSGLQINEEEKGKW